MGGIYLEVRTFLLYTVRQLITSLHGQEKVVFVWLWICLAVFCWSHHCKPSCFTIVLHDTSDSSFSRMTEENGYQSGLQGCSPGIGAAINCDLPLVNVWIRGPKLTLQDYTEAKIQELVPLPRIMIENQKQPAALKLAKNCILTTGKWNNSKNGDKLTIGAFGVTND